MLASSGLATVAVVETPGPNDSLIAGLLGARAGHLACGTGHGGKWPVARSAPQRNGHVEIRRFCMSRSVSVNDRSSCKHAEACFQT